MRPSRSFPITAVAVLVVTVSACTDGVPLAPGPVATAAVTSTQRNTARRAPGDRYVILAKSEAVSQALRAAVAAEGGRVERSMDAIGVLTARGLTPRAVAKIRARVDVEAVGADLTARWIPPRQELMRSTRTTSRRTAAESDQTGAAFLRPFQWNMRVIRASNAWLVTNQGRGALVCILDTGVDPGHLDLEGKVDLAKSTSFVVNEPFVEDLNFHGTFVASLVSSNGIGIGSVAPDAKLCAVKVLDATGSGTFADVTGGIVFASLVDADAVNMSLGTYVTRDELRDPTIRALQRAIDFATRRGALVIASAGNDLIDFNEQPDVIHIPSGLRNVVSVGATGPVAQQDFDRVASYSNFGNRGVDVFAPGGDFVPEEGGVLEDLIIGACSSFVEGCEGGVTYALSAGTSFAVPHVSGEAAVIESEFGGDQKPARLEQCIFRGADRITGRRSDPVYGRGRINVLGGALCAPIGTVFAGNATAAASLASR